MKNEKYVLWLKMQSRSTAQQRLLYLIIKSDSLVKHISKTSKSHLHKADYVCKKGKKSSTA